MAVHIVVFYVVCLSMLDMDYTKCHNPSTDAARSFRATMGFATLTSISVRVVAFLLTGLLLEPKVWLVALGAVPAAMLGIAVARRMYLRVTREQLLRMVAGVLLVTGGSLVLRSLAGT